MLKIRRWLTGKEVMEHLNISRGVRPTVRWGSRKTKRLCKIENKAK